MRIFRDLQSISNLPDSLLDVDITLVVPVRNEEKNIPNLLKSLRSQTDRRFQLVIANDGSTDMTAAVIKETSSKLGMTDKLTFFDVGERPTGWSPKVWACHEGASHIRTPLVLFLDADVTLSDRAIAQVKHLLSSQVVCTSLPYFFPVKIWELIEGVYWTVVLSASHVPHSKFRRFCIGQFLGFQMDFYRKAGGHKAVWNELAEDQAMEKHLRKNFSIKMSVCQPGLYSVRMYESFGAFLVGWKRILRLGLVEKEPISIAVPFLLVMGALMAAGSLWTGLLKLQTFSFWGFSLYALWAAFFFFFSRKFTRSSAASATAYPLAILVFVWISAAAAASQLLRREYRWRGRRLS